MDSKYFFLSSAYLEEVRGCSSLWSYETKLKENEMSVDFRSTWDFINDTIDMHLVCNIISDDMYIKRNTEKKLEYDVIMVVLEKKMTIYVFRLV